MPDSKQHDDDWLEEEPSKSARKREMHALQAMGETLVQLTEKQLQQITIEDENLMEAIIECRNIRSNSARKRHMQYIGKLMRKTDISAIEAGLASLHHTKTTDSNAFHEIETLRDAMIAQGPNSVELAMAKFPDADRQHIRQLLLQHQREVAKAKPPAASRKLFRYLKDLQTL
ncbi:MAG: ribosome biogenesis factor YjgA [Halioglobus sp.]